MKFLCFNFFNRGFFLELSSFNFCSLKNNYFLIVDMIFTAVLCNSFQVSSTSLLFDIRLQEGITSGVCSHKPFAAVSLSLTQSLKNGYASEIPLYSPCWVMFPQNIVIDTSAGLFASISLHPEESEIFIKDQVNFLFLAIFQQKI